MIQDKGIKEDWWVLFTASRMPTGILKWLQPSFQHVKMMKKSPGGTYWIILDSVRSHLSVEVASVDEHPHPRSYSPQAVILPVTVIADGLTPRGGLCWFNCVEVAKAVMGIKAFFVFTPYQLYKYLRRKGNG